MTAFLKTIKILIYVVVFLVIIYFALKLTSSTSKPSTKINLDQASVITEIEALSKLETASFTIEKIIEAGVQGNAFQNILYGDKILLIAHANVVAGFDLAKLNKELVKVKGTKLEITLPAPEILYSRLDNDQTRVYDRKLGLLTKGDAALESQARAAAEQSIRKAACDGGILPIAAENGRKQFQTMFASAGFTEVIVLTPVGECK
ncbi:MAG: hypothetical protein RJB39_391 [Candidatus Parcubacteria bacterium]|jgi:hypothetical protein